LRGKYGRQRIDNRTLIIKTANSHIWKGIGKIWKELEKGERWSIGDGSEVSFWNDSWLDFNLWLSNIIANILDNIKD
jgi:hypothetical protein